MAIGEIAESFQTHIMTPLVDPWVSKFNPVNIPFAELCETAKKRNTPEDKKFMELFCQEEKATQVNK